MPSAQRRSGYNTAYGADWSGSALTRWLDSTVAAAKTRGDHMAVVTHEPYWSSGTDGHSETEGDAQRPWIDVLDKHDVPLLLTGHQLNYERFHPQNATSVRNDATGTQEFQVSNAAPPAHHGAPWCAEDPGASRFAVVTRRWRLTLVGFVAVDPESSVVPVSL